MATTKRETWLWIGAALVIAALAWSGWKPYSRTTWWAEVAPVLIVLPILILTYRRYPLTNLLYVLILLHCLVLIMGGAYTYSRVPIGNWVQEAFGLDRNPYDRLGHLFQGFVPAIAAREILIRGHYVRTRGMLAFIVICIVMAISATYELVEYAAAVFGGDGSVEFLGTQGDPWDAQNDMICAGLGAIVALLTLSRLHDRQLASLPAALLARQRAVQFPQP